MYAPASVSGRSLACRLKYVPHKGKCGQSAKKLQGGHLAQQVSKRRVRPRE